jgi:O-acetyl-ADP-ribose deacetylase (regulator of RNase III)
MNEASPGRRRATRDLFTVVDGNLAATPLPFNLRYTSREWELIQQGLVPDSMDDKWLIFEEGGWLLFARSWTGRVFYKVRFQVGPEGAVACAATANLRPALVDDATRAFCAREIEWLISYWLLGEESARYPSETHGRAQPRVELVREPLPFVAGVHAVAYGAKDTGAMGGGAAAAILAAAGELLVPELRTKLASTSRRVGDAVVTPSFGLASAGIACVGHIVSIITNTPQGDWCPYPEKLYDGVRLSLRQLALEGCRNVALSALATGEGRVKPGDAARIMLEAIRDHQREDSRKLDVVLSLPTREDYDAFDALLART